MPQEFHVLRCYSCSVFQVHIVKKSNKWQCKMCNEKQSLKKVYGVGTGKDCRIHVQKLNSLHLAEQEQAGSTVKQLSTGASSHSLTDLPSQHFTSEYVEEQESVHNEPETSGQSKWDRYIEVKPQQDSESDSEEPPLQPRKKRKVDQPQSAQFPSSLDKKYSQQKETFLPSKSVISKQLSRHDIKAGGNSNFNKGKWGKYVTNRENDTSDFYTNSAAMDQDSTVRKYSRNNLSSSDNIPQESVMFNSADHLKSSSSKTPNRWSKYLDNFPQPQSATTVIDHPEPRNFPHPSFKEPDEPDTVEIFTKNPINFSIANEDLSDEELDNLLQF